MRKSLFLPIKLLILFSFFSFLIPWGFGAYAQNNQPPTPPCARYSTQEEGKCLEFDTGLGTFKTEPNDFVVSVFGFLISIAGGIAIILIMIAGYKMMLSKGNPDQLQQAREQLIAAIVGLMFLIFSFVFLQLIGIDILRIPGISNGGASVDGKSCDVAGNNQCSSGYTCVSISGRSGVCKRSTGASCDVAGNNQCPAGQACVSNSGGRDGTCR